MQLQCLRKAGFLVAAVSAITLSSGIITPKALAQRNIKVYCFRPVGSSTLSYGADASSIGSLTVTVYRNDRVYASKSSRSSRKIRGKVANVSGDRTWKVVATGEGASSDTCIVT